MSRERLSNNAITGKNALFMHHNNYPTRKSYKLTESCKYVGIT